MSQRCVTKTRDKIVIVVRGAFSLYVGYSAIIRLAADGTLDYTFISAGHTLGQRKTTLERRTADGPRDPTFGDDGVVTDAPPSNTVELPSKLMMQSDGMLLLSSRTYGAQTGTRLSRYFL
ncbi:hypothetical protein PTE30175_02819 [Pandoraea terrae]|uniref:Uncharacterized protein n=1 Tax=Pandoraea terrae TaxID=1537710 RepID=A0A5E4VYI0_9BURK|nr:delta-60 repeat domain-containing protein [Pandoraea terrae]VVE16334.1 hypothetical protein PTE30175_02819 [Pandoraea terrae]